MSMRKSIDGTSVRERPCRDGQCQIDGLHAGGPFEVVKDATEAFGLIIFSSGEDIGGVSNKRLVSFQMDLIH